MFHKSLLSFSLALALTLVACDDSSSSGSSTSQNLSAAEGIYKLDSYAYNTEACSKGTNTLANKTENHVAMVAVSSAFGNYLQVVTCPSVDSCQTLVDNIRNNKMFLIDFSATFMKGSVANGLTAEYAGSGYWHSDGTCTEGRLENQTLKFTGTAFQYAAEIQKASTYQQVDGYCDTDEVQKHLNPCSEMETMTGTYVQALE